MFHVFFPENGGKRERRVLCFFDFLHFSKVSKVKKVFARKLSKTPVTKMGGEGASPLLPKKKAVSFDLEKCQ